MAGISSSFISAAYIYNAIYCICKLGKDTWIIHSGASDHMNFDATAPHDMQNLKHPISVSLPTGHTVQVTQYQQLRLNDWIVLQHVLLVPYFRYNSATLWHGLPRESLYLAGPFLKRPLAGGREFLGLYILDKALVENLKRASSSENSVFRCNKLCVQHTISNVSCHQSSRNLDFGIWHMRMGHIPRKEWHCYLCPLIFLEVDRMYLVYLS